MRKAFTYRIYLTNGQRRIREQQREACRWGDNETRATRKNAGEPAQRTVVGYETTRALPLRKDRRPALKLVHTQVVQNVPERGARAFKAFCRRGKAGEPAVGAPRCTGRGRSDRITAPQDGNGVRLDGDRLMRAKGGAVHGVLPRPMEGTPKTVPRTRSRTGTWYAWCSGAVEAQPLPPPAVGVGVDVGLASFATLATGDEIDNPRFSRRDDADLKRGQTLQDAAQNAPRWDEHRRRKKALAHIHERMTNRRADFAHKRRRERGKRDQASVVEALAPLALGRSRGMRKSSLDVAWSQCISMTVAKAEAAGRRIVLVPPGTGPSGARPAANSCRRGCATAPIPVPRAGWYWDVIPLRRSPFCIGGSKPFGCNELRVGRHTQQPNPSGWGAVTIHRRCSRHGCQGFVQSSIDNPGTRANSRTLLVTKMSL